MDILKPLLAPLAIVNPIGVVPFFIRFTRDFGARQRRRTIHVAAVGAFVAVEVVSEGLVKLFPGLAGLPR